MKKKPPASGVSPRASSSSCLSNLKLKLAPVQKLGLFQATSVSELQRVGYIPIFKNTKQLMSDHVKPGYEVSHCNSPAGACQPVYCKKKTTTTITTTVTVS